MRSAAARLTAFSAFIALALAAPTEVQVRGFSDGAYAPYQVTCPTNITWVRNATDGLSSGEQAYISARSAYTGPAANTMLSSHGLSNPPRTPVVGVALAGGGYRAMLTGLGGVMAMMNQSTEAADSGIGGWLEAVTYWAGLSGGSWATGSFMANGGQLPTDLLENLWNLSSNLIYPDDDKISFYTDIVAEIDAKSDKGFPTQITDAWGLAIASHVLPNQYSVTNTPNVTFSSLPSVVGALSNASLPMPIIIAAEREAGEIVVAENATVWEFTPYEFGSWAFGSVTKSPGAFTPLEYLGTSVNAGSANSTCWKGFDQMAYVMGTSATLFNSLLLTLNGTSTSILTSALESILGSLSDADADVSRVPNTFANYNPTGNPISSLEYVTLIDAGETNQNIPIEPLLIPSRNVDAIIAFDSSYDTDTIWPNGTALRTTYERSLQLAMNQNVNIRMPAVPSENGFINGGYNSRPTFFGCNETDTPIVIYVPNYPWSYAANTSTYQLEYSNDQALGVMLNGMRSFTLNGTVASWPQCLSCALSDRAFNYTSSNRSSECQACFNTWCWDGTDNTTTPNLYSPAINSVPPWLLANNLSSGAAEAAGSSSSSSTANTTSSSGSSGNSSAARGEVTLSSIYASAVPLGILIGLSLIV